MKDVFTSARFGRAFASSLLLVAMFWAAPGMAHAAGCTKPLLHLDAKGSVAGGSKQKLIAAINDGSQVRVGWKLGPSDILTHWAEPTFISIFKGNVYAQLPTIHLQRGIAKTGTIELYGTKADFWYGLVATDGQLSGRHGSSGKLETAAVEQTWCKAQ